MTTSHDQFRGHTPELIPRQLLGSATAGQIGIVIDTG